jgi:bifunctional DNase/RNase
MIKIEHNVETNEITTHDLTNEELNQLEIDAENVEINRQKEITKLSEKAALLAKLGITDDEAKLLLS